MSDNNIDLILKDLSWLENRKTSTDIVSISQVLNHLAILSVRLGEEVSEAYKLQQELKDNYDIKFAQKFSELTKSGTSAAAAKPIVEAELADDKRSWTAAGIGYKKLSSFLERIDRVMDTWRQAISVQKMSDLKNI
jgi:ATP-dependent exoDNAse (exonuclease V) alpha subunit